MKKLLLSLVTAFLLFTCNNDAMDDSEDKSKECYLTLSYHSEGHTSGEVPVDDTKYPIVATGYTWEKDFAEPYVAKNVKIYAGTLKKDGARLLGWNTVKQGHTLSNGMQLVEFNLRGGTEITGDYFLDEGGDHHVKLYAAWSDL